MRNRTLHALAAALACVMAACMGGAASLPAATPTGLPSGAATPRATPPGSTSAEAPGDPIRIPLSGAAPDAIVVEGSTAWVLAGEGGSLMEVDLDARRELRAIEVGFGATHLALPTPGIAVVARFDNSATGTYLPVIELGTGAAYGITTDALGGLAAGESGLVWALEKDGHLLKVDPMARRVLGSLDVTIGRNVHTEVQWGAGSAWVGSDGTPVVRVGSDLRIAATIEVDTGLPFLVRDGLVWGAGPTQLWAIDATTNSVTRRIRLDQVIEVLALDVDGDEAWLAVRHPGAVGAVLRLGLGSGEVVAEHPVSLPAAVMIAPKRAWVASYLTNELVGFAR